jgi:hypothetical protein
VTLSGSCTVSIDIQPNKTTGGTEFAVTGIALIPFSTGVPLNQIDNWDMLVNIALGDQLPFNWPNTFNVN